MRIAIKDFERAEASPGDRGYCPTCLNKVIAKCGDVMTWHWAHEQNDCDPWSEGETEWHLRRKSKFPTQWQEVTIGNHRADVKTPDYVIEFQHSLIPSPE